MKLKITIEIIIVIIFIITIPIALILGKNISTHSVQTKEVKANESASQYLQKGEQLYNQGRAKYNDASVQYWEALKHDPKLADAHFRLAEMYYEYIWNYEALNELQEIEKIDAKYPGLYLLIGKLHHRMGDIDKSFQAFQRNVALDPQNPESHYYLGTIYQQKNAKEEALKEYQQAVTAIISPSFKDSIIKSYLQLGRIYKTDRDFDSAMEFLKKAITIEPKSVEVISELTNVYSQKAGQYKIERNFDEAGKIYEEIVRLAPDNIENIEYYMELGSIYKSKEFYDKAISVYKSVTKLDPLNFDAFTSIKELELIISGKISQ
ncbi:MAG: tetratricopeptide repeat protein [Candidatus Poribacteria bacterium]